MVELDWGHVIAGGLAGAATALAAWIPRRSKSQTTSTTETVDGDVLAQFMALAQKVTDLELVVQSLNARLDETRKQLGLAQTSLAEMQKVEEYLRGAMHEKDAEIRALRAAADRKQAEIVKLRERVKHLEEVCRRAGINGDIQEADC